MLRSAHTCCGGRKLPFDRRPNKKAVPQRRSKLKKDKLEPLRIRPDCAPEKKRESVHCFATFRAIW
jgi:hypothetical protein